MATSGNGRYFAIETLVEIRLVEFAVALGRHSPQEVSKQVVFRPQSSIAPIFVKKQQMPHPIVKGLLQLLVGHVALLCLVQEIQEVHQRFSSTK